MILLRANTRFLSRRIPVLSKRFPPFCNLTLSSTSSIQPAASPAKKTPFVDKEGFVQVFKFPLAAHCALVTRLKLYQTVATFALLPVFCFVTEADHETILGAVSLSTLALVVLAAFGELSRRILGIVYFRPETNEVKLAHLTFFGGRQDSVVPLDSLIPLSETPEHAGANVWAVHFYGRAFPSMFICTKLGGIKDRKLFAEIFGKEALEFAAFRDGDDLGEEGHGEGGGGRQEGL